ncbi:MAG: hypothetical protein J0H34_22280 [Rhizobiales bacterium]|nr:hypothetical protein [Hyphomicrobiales bacterium]
MEVKREGRGYLVVDEDETLGPFVSVAAAFREVLARGGRVHLEWGRTTIGGETRPKDFAARFEGQNAGRIYVMGAGTSAGLWGAFPSGHNRETSRMGGGSMIVDTRDEAIEFIERKFTELMAGVAQRPSANDYAKAKGL